MVAGTGGNAVLVGEFVTDVPERVVLPVVVRLEAGASGGLQVRVVQPQVADALAQMLHLVAESGDVVEGTENGGDGLDAVERLPAGAVDEEPGMGVAESGVLNVGGVAWRVRRASPP